MQNNYISDTAASVHTVITQCFRKTDLKKSTFYYFSCTKSINIGDWKETHNIMMRRGRRRIICSSSLPNRDGGGGWTVSKSCLTSLTPLLHILSKCHWPESFLSAGSASTLLWQEAVAAHHCESLFSSWALTTRCQWRIQNSPYKWGFPEQRGGKRVAPFGSGWVTDRKG